MIGLALAPTLALAHALQPKDEEMAHEFQVAGLGTALTETSSQEVARRRFKEVSPTATELNAGTVCLYQRLGFEALRSFGAFTWNRRQPSRRPEFRDRSFLLKDLTRGGVPFGWMPYRPAGKKDTVPHTAGGAYAPFCAGCAITAGVS